MSVSGDISLKKGEAKTLKFVYKDTDGVVIDMSAATFSLAVKELKSDETASIDKDDADFDKSEAASGIVKVAIAAADLANMDTGTYIAEIEATFSAANIDRSDDVTFYLNRPVH